MNVLVTGSAGFIGTAVARELTDRGYTPKSFDAPLDVRNKDDVRKALADAQGVINLAGVLGTSEIFGAEYEAAKVNILGAINVLDVAKDMDIPMVQISAGHEGQPNPYAITKKCITDLCLARAQWKGQKVSVVRAFHVYGPGQKMCAPHGTSKVRKIIPSFVARALTGMPIEINGSGRQMVDLVYLDDAAKVIVDGLEEGFGEILEAGTGCPVTVLDAAKDVVEACRSKSPIHHVTMRHGEPEETSVYAKNPRCPHPWPYALDLTIEWYREKLSADLKISA